MFRNLSKRLEVIAPVTTRSARERLWEILDVSLKDQRQAWLMDSDAGYTQLRPDPQVDAADSLGTHETLIALTRRRLTQSG